ncbi:hypothetical protein BV898_05670 [Hypsibius exemplaris]|uniref:DUF3456 domain-containing protein n=1 Tax=Hypsibius exemplaris TaxID=2072580 RepID=A0A1W0WYW4_HYPEX|nr:hypothetical protein BV898_05670 [Hypsibius exemplaris]
MLARNLFTRDTRKIDYSRSELRLIEVLDSVCDKVADYHVHSKEGMQRYAKQERIAVLKWISECLGELVEKQPNKEIMALKRRCEALAEEYEDDLSRMVLSTTRATIAGYFCRKNILKGEDQSCLDQPGNLLDFLTPTAPELAKRKRKALDPDQGQEEG